MFEIVKLEDVAINNNVISQGESSIALKDAFGKFEDNITYNKATVTGVVGKTCRPQPSSARKKAEGEVLAIYPMEIVNTSVPVTEAKSQKEDFGISGENGCITIIGEWKEIEIFDAKGRLISRDKATTACSAGIYFVKVNDMTHIVKVD